MPETDSILVIPTSLDDSDELSDEPRAAPHCPKCKADFAGPDKSADLLANDDVTLFKCDACQGKVPPWVFDSWVEYERTNGLKRKRNGARGRPVLVPDPQVVTFKVNKAELAEFDSLVGKEGRKRSEVLRALMTEYVRGRSDIR